MFLPVASRKSLASWQRGFLQLQVIPSSPATRQVEQNTSVCPRFLIILELNAKGQTCAEICAHQEGGRLMTENCMDSVQDDGTCMISAHAKTTDITSVYSGLLFFFFSPFVAQDE